MARYTVPQDVEAEDKLIGPFSFRQFIYLIIAAIGIGGCWALFSVFPPLAIIPLPIVILFGILALPLKKEQPMEVYLGAIIQFHLKPRKRVWKPDGLTSLVEITAPKKLEEERAAALERNEAERRLSYLADIVDTGGWAVRGVGLERKDDTAERYRYYAPTIDDDPLDKNSSVSRNIDAMITKTSQQRREHIMAAMQSPDQMISTPDDIYALYDSLNIPPSGRYHTTEKPLAPAQPEPEETTTPDAPPADFDMSAGIPLVASEPIPVEPDEGQKAEAVLREQTEQVDATYEAIHGPTPTKPAKKPAKKISVEPASERFTHAKAGGPAVEPPQVSAGILDLAHNSGDLSVETIQREARRVNKKNTKPGEVYISLR